MKKKLALILLSAVTAICGALGLSACGNGNSAEEDKDSQIYSVYQTYVAHAEDNGQTALSYEEWLKTIKGEKGDTGATGAQGEKGDDGVGIQSVTVNESGELVITNTKGEVIYQGEIPSCIHTYGEPVDLISACTVRWVVKECSKCGDTQVTSATPVGHTAADWTRNDSKHWRICSVCQETMDEGLHNFNEKQVCGVCGYAKSETQGLEFTLNTDHYVLSGIGTATGGEIIVPASYMGLPVKAIGEDAFYRNLDITSIIIPDSVTSIGRGAFYSCENMTNVYIPDSVTDIGKNAFYYCKGLTSINIPNSVKNIGESAFYLCRNITNITIPDGVTNIGETAFGRCYSLTGITFSKSVVNIAGNVLSECLRLESITVEKGNEKYHSAGNCLIETVSKSLIAGCKNSVIPADGSVTAIADEAFYGCEGLTSVTIPDCVTTIADKAFYGCEGLISIIIPDCVTTIGRGVFAKCNAAKVTVASGNTNYYIAGNCLIEKASKTLIAGFSDSVIPNDGSITSIGDSAFEGINITEAVIPYGVTNIGYAAFGICEVLTSISIPNSVTSIGDYAFTVCEALTSITIPVSVKSIGVGVFQGSFKLDNIIYSGTVAQWQAIEKAKAWYIGIREVTVINCTDGDLDKRGNAVTPQQ